MFGSVGNDRNQTNGFVHVFAGLFSFLVLDACFYGRQCGFIPLMVQLWHLTLGTPNVVNKQLGVGIDFKLLVLTLGIGH